MFWKKKKAAYKVPFDREKQKAVVRCSICTGEQVAGFKDRETGKFTEVMAVKGSGDLERFMEMYGVERVEKEY